MYWSIILNFLLIVAVIIDRIYRLKSIKEFREAKEAVVIAKDATIESLKMQLEASEKNNDVALAEMAKKRVDYMKEFVEEREKVNEDLKAELEQLKKAKPNTVLNDYSKLIELILSSNIQTNEAFQNFYNLDYKLFINYLHSKPTANFYQILARKKRRDGEDNEPDVPVGA